MTMPVHRLDHPQIESVQRDLDRLHARCAVMTKHAPRGAWQPVASSLATFREALEIADRHAGTVVEVGVFIEHDHFGGIIVWTSLHPGVANRHGDLQDPAPVEGPGPVPGWAWIEDMRADMRAVLPALRQTAVGQTIIVNSFDSSFAKPTAEELAIGWRDVPAGMALPIAADLAPPWEQYDEWWVVPNLEAASTFPEYEPFVNMGRWSLRSPQDQRAYFDRSWDKDAFSWLLPQQERFWRLVDEQRPIAYIANGDSLIVASSSQELLSQVRTRLAEWKGSLRRR